MRAQRLGASFDLLAAYEPERGSFFERNGIGVAVSGGDETVGPAAAVSRLRELGRGIVAVGSLPFAGQGTLAIPVGGVRRTGSGDVASIGAGPAMHRRPIGVAPRDPFAEPQTREVPTAEDYGRSVSLAVERIRTSTLRKVVLARCIEVDAARVLDPRRLAQRLRVVNPGAYTFATPTTSGVLVGASPELLVSRFGREVRSNPLAGSAPRSGDPAEDRAFADRLIASAKDRDEHRIVVEDVARVLGPCCSELTWDPEPVLLETPNVWHLSTRFRGVLREPMPSVLDLVGMLHPTPAVAGTPRDDALATIAELEPFQRSAYAGPVGWVDAEGDGEWAIALRCAILHGDRATLFAGAGIVADSVPAAEVDETDRKFRAFLDALRWG
jgi:isochorismate synthase